MDFIRVRGAREHNLKNIDLDIPKNRLVVFTGLSGSGKSSMAFDTIYAEGQRRYVESLSSYARQFLGVMDKPDVNQIDGLSPAISIDQKSTSHNPRSTVGTVTEIYDYLRLLFARIGHPHCPNCNREISRQSVQQIVNQCLLLISEVLKTAKTARFLLLSPVVRGRKGEFTDLFANLRHKGYTQVRLDGQVISLNSDILLLKNNKHNIDVVIDRIVADKTVMSDSGLRTRLFDSIEQALKLSEGLCVFSRVLDKTFDFPQLPRLLEDHLFSEKFSCPVCNLSLPEIEPRMFSFNSPHGACPTCSGLGSLLKIDENLLLNPNLTISEGGILPYANAFTYDSWFAQKIQQFVPVKIPIKDLTPNQRQLLLYGSQSASTPGRDFPDFEGVIPNLQRRHQQTESDYVRSEIEKFMRRETCPDCRGARLKPEVLKITVNQASIADICALSISDALEFFRQLRFANEREQSISQPIVKEIMERSGFLVSVGLDYLTLDRPASTLSGGEAQRIRLASQIGSGLSGVLYVLDEPSIGLHQRDNQRLIDTLKHLRDLGNSVLVVEHDTEMMLQSDWIIDFGPGAGDYGGRVVSSGPPASIISDPASLTGQYLSGSKKISLLPSSTGSRDQTNLVITGVSQHNLKNLTVSFPLGRLICVAGVSGSGKSTLLIDVLYHALARQLHPDHRQNPGQFESLFISDSEGRKSDAPLARHINRVIMVDQSPIGRTPRSNPATYTGLFTPIRELFALTPQAKIRGYTPGRFSFNVKGGRCEACQGEGQLKIEMQFLPDIYVTCEVCRGARYNSETLEVQYKGKNISEVLNLSITQALEFFASVPAVLDKLNTLKDVGLDYIRLGQPAPTLSGGEAQRVKLAAELSKRATGKTVYILDEPTTGLHFADLEKLLQVLRRLVDSGNTVLVIEHNLDVIRNSDWVIELGPGGGASGGQLIASCPPSQLKKIAASSTGPYI